jgi:uncharacterized protein (DUF433 family)
VGYNGGVATTLDREVYSEADAARILRVAPATLHWWLEGGKRRGKTYPPVLRPEPTGKRSLTWAEFVEAGLLRGYRRDLGVQLPELRRFIDRLRAETGVPYPLAHHRPWAGGGRLILEQQQESGLPGDLSLVVVTEDQALLFTEPAQAFLRRVDWDAAGAAASWRPHEDEGSPVLCDPLVRFGHPAIKGISTEAIDGHLRAGEDEVEVAEQYDLAVEDVLWARAYELSQRSVKPAA